MLCEPYVSPEQPFAVSRALAQTFHLLPRAGGSIDQVQTLRLEACIAQSLISPRPNTSIYMYYASFLTYPSLHITKLSSYDIPPMIVELFFKRFLNP